MKKLFTVRVVRHSNWLPIEWMLVPRIDQGQVRCSFEQPGLVGRVPAHGRRFGTRRSLRILPSQTIQIVWFYGPITIIDLPQNYFLVRGLMWYKAMSFWNVPRPSVLCRTGLRFSSFHHEVCFKRVRGGYISEYPGVEICMWCAQETDEGFRVSHVRFGHLNGMPIYLNILLNIAVLWKKF